MKQQVVHISALLLGVLYNLFEFNTKVFYLIQVAYIRIINVYN